MSKIGFTKRIIESIVNNDSIDTSKPLDNHSFTILTSECLLACEYQDVNIGKAMDSCQMIYAEGFTDSLVSAIKRIWGFMVKCYETVVKWLKNMWTRFKKTTSTAINTMNAGIDAFLVDKKVINFFKGKKQYKAAVDGDAPGLMKWYDIGEKLDTDDKKSKKVFMAHDIYHVVGLNIFTKPWYKEFVFAYSSKDSSINTLSAAKVFDELFVDIERISSSKVAATAFQDRIMKTVDPILKWMNANSKETGGFTLEGKYTKSKYILNGLLCHENEHAIGQLHLPNRMLLKNSELSITEDIDKTYFEYEEKMYNHDNAYTLLTAIKDKILHTAKLDTKNLQLAKSIDEGGKTFKVISEGYQKLYDNIDKMNSEGKLTFKPEELKKLSLLTSWYTSGIVSTFVVADMVIHDSAAKIKEAIDAGYKLVKFFGAKDYLEA